MNRTTRRTSAVARAVAAAVTVATLAAPQALAAPGDGAADADPAATAATAVDLVDARATPETRSLFAYLRDIRGEGMLFGHQHTTNYGETFTEAEADGVRSDVLAATGDHPAVFGFDTLIIEGRERPGSTSNTREENALILAGKIREAHDLGGISTLSVHMENFVTGGDFYDTGGDTLRAILPGGSHHQDLVDYLDTIAVAADGAVTADGTPIPVVFRPFHENGGSWFWWGAAFGTPGEYQELYRFTVEYLRDVKGVHNFLYAFSPGGGFGGDAETYLRTYPGDDFIDLLGVDTYDSTGASEAGLTGITQDLAMIADLADERGKVSAFTEFGLSGGVRPDGENANPRWYTALLDAIHADPAASRNAYMLTWANFGGSTTPYTPTEGEMLADFRAYHDDPYSWFADDVAGAFTAETDPAPETATVHLASPAPGSRVATGPVTFRASIRDAAADGAHVTVGDTRVTLTPPSGAGSLWWTGAWDVPAELLDNSTRTVTLTVTSGGAVVHTREVPVVFGPAPSYGPGVVDDFEGYGDDDALAAQYVRYGANELDLVTAADGPVGEGEQAVRMSYDFATQGYTGFGRQVGADWSGNWAFQAWVDPDASSNKLVLQMVAGGVSYEAYPSLAGDEPYLATIPFADWRPAPWDTAHADRRVSQEDLADVTQFNVYVNKNETGAASGAVVLDDVRAVEGTPPPPRYSDVPRDHEFYDEIEWFSSVYDGWGTDGRFKPREIVYGEEFARVLRAYDADADVPGIEHWHPRWAVARTLWELYGSPEPEGGPATYSDVPREARTAVAWAVEAGVIEPYSDQVFGAWFPLKRQEVAVYLYNYDQLPPPLVPETLFDFADGAQGWYPLNGNGTTTPSGGALTAEFGAGGDWLGVTGAWDLTGRTALTFDAVATTGFDAKVALQLGRDWTWCETGYTGWTSQPGTVTVDLTTMSADCRALLGDVKAINVYLNEGTHTVDDVGVS
ncbi:glycosyl hydrolase [Myceligenerans crystallogenes]|uniref:Mannan endo-1,4-beta-mannosidase n=1 Tax=Myceligenerans crystallogenes TaxID=316335 RepID=A0ABN2NB07_9MICO